MSTPQDDRLIQYIHIARKWKSCDTVQMIEVLSRLPRIFAKHDALHTLSDLIKQLIHPHSPQRLPLGLLVAIQDALLLDDDMDLEDTVYRKQTASNTERFGRLSIEQQTNQKYHSLWFESQVISSAFCSIFWRLRD